MTTRYFISSALCALACLATVTLRAEEIDTKKIAATVNGEPITVAEVAVMTPEAERGSEEVRKAALEKLIDRILMAQAIRKKAALPAAIVEERIQEIVQDSFKGNRAEFEEALKKQGSTLEMFKKFQETELLVWAMGREIYGAETNPVVRAELIAAWVTTARAKGEIVYH